MSQRIAFQELPAEFMGTILKINSYLKHAGLDPVLQELIKYRASQINRCAPCLDMHWKDAIAAGETPQRLHSLVAWPDCPYYTEKERVVLALTDTLTNANHEDVSDELFRRLQQHFSNADIANLTLAVAEINVWNRLNKVLLPTPGLYQPAK